MWRILEGGDKIWTVFVFFSEMRYTSKMQLPWILYSLRKCSFVTEERKRQAAAGSLWLLLEFSQRIPRSNPRPNNGFWNEEITPGLRGGWEHSPSTELSASSDVSKVMGETGGEDPVLVSTSLESVMGWITTGLQDVTVLGDGVFQEVSKLKLGL